MPRKKSSSKTVHSEFPKALTGIQGLDEITGGGLPQRTNHVGLRKPWLWKNTIGHGVPCPRDSGKRRARCDVGVRGNGQGIDRKRPVPGV